MPTESAVPIAPAGGASLDEKAVLAGLKKRKLAERVAFVRAAPATKSRVVFDALAALYPTDNPIKPTVLHAMRRLNEAAGFALSAALAEAVRAEVLRKCAAADDSGEAHFDLLLSELRYWLEHPRAEVDAFVEWAAASAAELRSKMPSGPPAVDGVDPFVEEVRDAAALYEAARGRGGSLAALAKRLSPEPPRRPSAALSSARETALTLFAEARDPAFVDFGGRLILSADVRFAAAWERFAAAFEAYAAAVGRPLPPDVAARVRALREAAAAESSAFDAAFPSGGSDAL